jgi:hypothetical protein
MEFQQETQDDGDGVAISPEVRDYINDAIDAQLERGSDTYLWMYYSVVAHYENAAW